MEVGFFWRWLVVPHGFSISKRIIRKYFGLISYIGRRFFGYPAAWLNRRISLNTTVVGITGSVGKTTTKDISATVLSEFGDCGATIGSKNDRFAVAKSLLRIRLSQKYFVVEIGGNKPGQLDFAMGLVRPSVGVLTNVGRDHYSAFKSVDNIAAEKAKIVHFLPEGALAVLNMDDPHVRAIGEACSHKKIWVGRSESATIRLLEASSKWPEALVLKVEYNKTEYRIETQLYGEHMALPVLCALGVAAGLNLAFDKAIAGVSKVTATEGRMQIVEGEDGVVFIRDDWKAPDWTLQAPIEFLREAKAERKVAIIGSISDFSTDSTSKYKQIAKRVMAVADLVIFVGPNAHRALRARKDPDDQSLLGFERIIDAARFLKNELRKGDLVLLKGSAKADHLVRLLYDRYQPVQCWEDRCGRNQFCGACPKLYEPHQNTAEDPLNGTEPVVSWGDSAGKATVIVGLGNPGTEYEGTPHNIGYEAVDVLAGRAGAIWTECPQGLVSRVELFPNDSVLLFKPLSKMNVSGASVRKLLMEQNGHPQKCIVVHDDMDLRIGDARLKLEGSSAGHKGVKSVLSELKSHAVTRIRVGVRSGEDQSSARQRVLTVFRAEDKSSVEEGVAKALELITQAVKNSQNTSETARSP